MEATKLLRSIACFVSLLLPVHSALCEAASDAGELEESDATFRLIAQEQLNQLSKIHSIEFSSFQRLKLLIPGDERESTNERHTIRSGDRGWCELTVRWRDGNEVTWNEVTKRTVWNERYVASWPIPNPHCEMYEFDSPESMTERARRMKLGANSRPELACGLGIDNRTLAEIAADREKYPVRFDVQRTDPGASRYLVKMFGPGLPHPSVEMIVDPNRGFIIDHYIYRDGETGCMTKECSVTAREVAPGIWFPSARSEKQYGNCESTEAQRPLTQTFDWELKDIVVNGEVPASQCEWPALGLAPSTQVWRKDSAGQTTRMKVENGELVPLSLAGRAPE